MRRKHSGGRRKLAVGAVLTLALISSVQALSCSETRRPVLTFIDFYIASQRAEAPPMSVWERVIYGLAIAKSEPRTSAKASPKP